MKKQFKKGAASFYEVAFSTLIILIIVASFTALVIAQITRSSNADLSQSAYDSALAGVEDAKLAFYNYESCLSQGASAKEPNDDNTLDCNEIVYIMEETDSCDMIAYVLGRKTYGDADAVDEGVVIEESSSSGNNMQQAYTCVKLGAPDDYRVTLSSANQMKVTRARFDNVNASEIETIRISWGDTKSEANWNYPSVSDLSDGQYAMQFKSLSASSGNVANPPIISVAILQTAGEFSLDQFNKIEGNEGTNRSMVYLVPTNDINAAGATSDSFIGAYKNDNNIISKSALVKSNDRTSKNLPYAVYCGTDNSVTDEFVCSATLELPKPIGGDRSNDNFIVAIALPYGKTETDVSLEFFCAEGNPCGQEVVAGDTGAHKASLKNMQLVVDSTGKANDLFRRVEARLERNEDDLLSIMGPLELFGDGSGSAGEGGGSDVVLQKNYAVTCEYPPFVDSPTCGT